MFLNSEGRQRNAFLEATQVEVRDTIQEDIVKKALGEQACLAIATCNNSLFMPNVRHGEIRVPRRYINTDAVPFVAMARGESLRFDTSARYPTPSQAQLLAEQLAKWRGEKAASPAAEIAPIISLMLDRPAEQHPGVIMGRANGKVQPYRQPIRIEGGPLAEGSPRSFIFEGRPVLALAYANDYAKNVTHVHELVHVQQHLAQATSPTDRSQLRTQAARQELEAYHYSTRYGAALFLSHSDVYSGDERLLHRQAIEKVRMAYADASDPFTPTTEMMGMLKAMGIEWASDNFLPDVTPTEALD